MITWNYRIVRETDGLFIREVFYRDNGEIGGCAQPPALPFGNTLQELTDHLAALQAALQLPILDLATLDAAAQQPAPQSSTGPNLSLAALRTQLAQESEDPTPSPAAQPDPTNGPVATAPQPLKDLTTEELTDLFKQLLRDSLQEALAELLLNPEAESPLKPGLTESLLQQRQ